MIHTFLKAKHWQLFLFFFAIPMGIFFGFFVKEILAPILNHSSGVPPVGLFNFHLLTMPVMLISIFILWSWKWSISIGLQSKLPQGVSMNVKMFKFAFFYVPIYTLGFLFVMFNILYVDFMEFSKLVDFTNATVMNIPIPIVMATVLGLHLLAMISMIYIVYFTAKTHKTVELQRATKLKDFIGDFFLIMYHPIGIWFIQPRINHIIQQDELNKQA